MPTISIDFTFTIQTCHFWVEEDIEFFFNAELAFSADRGVWIGTVYNFPCHRVLISKFIKMA